jgi:uncharacterized protein
MKKILFTFLFIVTVFRSAALTMDIHAVSLPNPNADFYVLDEAGVLSDSTLKTIKAVSIDLEKKTKAQIVVVIVNDLGGVSAETYGLSILRDWGIGDDTLNNGVLILLAMDEKISRIEVGYGLEGALNDAKTGRIQDSYMLPYFNQEDIDQGILNGYLAIVQEVAKEYKVTIDAKQPTAYTKPFDLWTDLPSWVIIGGIILIVLIIGALDLRFLDGNIMRLIFYFIFSMGKGSSYRGGGGSGGGGGSSRRW